MNVRSSRPAHCLTGIAVRSLALLSLSVLGPALFLAACGDSGGLKRVPRDRTLVLDCLEYNTCSGQIQDYDSFNPFLPGATSRIGYNWLYEPLYFYLAYQPEDRSLVPWIATGHEYDDDDAGVTIHLRHGVTWSDGEPWTAHDIVYTVDMLKRHAPELTFSTDMATWVEEVTAVDSVTVYFKLTGPNPRFVFSYFTSNFDNGIPIVPRHIWQNVDPLTFANYDSSGALPVYTGPYTIALSVPEQRIYDLRPDWWAAATGFQALPQVERIIYLPYQDEVKRVQSIISNYLDSSLDMRPPNIKIAVERNPMVTTWSGRESPYGRRDWWPIALGFNDLEPPLDNARIRWAINFAIDRQELLAIAWQGNGDITLLPFPDFPALHRYFVAAEDLLVKHPVGSYDLERSGRIMEEEGWQRDAEGFWARDGERLGFVIDIFDIHQDLAPVLVEQLRRAGFDVNFRNTPDAISRMMQGTARAFIMGHGGSVRDPYFTLRLYHSRYVMPTGTSAQNFWRWRNERFDALVDQMGRVAPEDPRLVELYRQALDIWLSELPSIPLLQWYHRIPMNTTYWTHWPTAQDPYANPSYWSRTWLLVLLGLEPR